MNPFQRSTIEEPVRQSVPVECLVCERQTTMRSDIRIGKCVCGAALLNPQFMARDNSVGSQGACEFCDNTGFVLFPMSSEGRFYTAVCRCDCVVGEKMSDKIPKVPDGWAQDSDPGMDTFFGRAEMVTRALGNVAKRLHTQAKSTGATK